MSNNLKILFVSSGNSHYQIVPFIRNQGESLRKEGAEVSFFTIEGKGFSGYFKNVKKLKTVILKNNHDVVHVHYSLSGMVAVLSHSKKPIVLSLMGSDTQGDFNSQGKRMISSYIPMLITQLIQPFVSAIIVKSHNLYKYTYRRKITYLIPNGVDFTKFRPMNMQECRNKLNLDTTKKYILFLANPKNPNKNFQLLQKAAKYLKSENTEIINPFPIANKDFPLYLNACDVFVLTSYNEGSPNVIKEAMACNCPVVATPVGDVEEVIKGVDGCFLTSFDEVDLAGKLDRALEFNGRTLGRKHIDHLREDKIATKLIEIYKSII